MMTHRFCIFLSFFFMSLHGKLVICLWNDENPYLKSWSAFIYIIIDVDDFELVKMWGLLLALRLLSVLILFLDVPAQTPSQVPTEAQGLLLN